ncbi:MAG: hypothetical protein Q8O56_12955 [Solirubrobacteraceae bacterium]|nr:hypothetical protein [Solirubrobacteraceae bacterium]
MILAVLEQDVPGLTARVHAMDRGQQRVLSRAAAQLALRVIPVDDPRLGRAWAALGTTPVDPAISDHLQVLVDELDDEAAAAQIELDDILETGGTRDRQLALTARYERAFARARACEALAAALEPDLDDAVGGALYEANAALDHSPATIRALVEGVASGASDPVGDALRQLAPR